MYRALCVLGAPSLCPMQHQAHRNGAGGDSGNGEHSL